MLATKVYIYREYCQARLAADFQRGMPVARARLPVMVFTAPQVAGENQASAQRSQLQ
jgi:hypothetical protein